MILIELVVITIFHEIEKQLSIHNTYSSLPYKFLANISKPKT